MEDIKEKTADEIKLDKLKKFLKSTFKESIQAFTTKNIVGDFTFTIYDEDEIQVDYAPSYEYIEIFGLTDEEFEELESEKIIY